MADKAKSAAMTLGLLILGGVIFLGIFIFPPTPSTDPLQAGILTGLPPSTVGGKSIVYAKNTTIGNNTYAIRVSSGNFVINNMVELMSFTSYTNSTLLENCTILDKKDVDYFCLYGSTRMTLRNIDIDTLTLYLFDNSELILDNCTFYQVGASDNSGVTISNSSISIVTDATMDPPGHVSSLITIQDNSTINQVTLVQGAYAIIDNSTINDFQVIKYGLSNPIRATITNSTITSMPIGGLSKVTVFGSNIFSATVQGLANVILDSCTVSFIMFGIICHTGVTNVINSAFPGTATYVNNTQFISTVPTFIGNVTSVTVNGTAQANIQGIAPGNAMTIESYDSGYVHISDTIPMAFLITIYSFENSHIDIDNSSIYALSTTDDSQLTAFNATISILIMGKNSNATIFNSTLDQSTINATASVAIHNSSVNMGFFKVSNKGAPAGNIYLTNTSIVDASVYGATVITFEDCLIGNLYGGEVLYSGLFIINSTYMGGGTLVNYTTLISTPVTMANYTAYLEINNTAAFNAEDWDLGALSIILYEDANTTLTNCTIGGVNLKSNTRATLSNVTSSLGIIAYGNTIFTVSQNSIISDIVCVGSTIGTVTDSTLQDGPDAYQEARLTVSRSKIFGNATVVGSNSLDYTLKIYNSTVDGINAINW